VNFVSTSDDSDGGKTASIASPVRMSGFPERFSGSGDDEKTTRAFPFVATS
jgi:hypothetical protein